MAQITLKGNPINTSGNLPAVGSKAPNFKLTGTDLADFGLDKFAGKTVVLNIFPSLDTPTCANSVRAFNKSASSLDNTVVLCVSKDLPFAHKRFCTTEGLENAISAAQLRDDSFTKAYGCLITDGPLAGLMSRAVVVVAPDGTVKYTQQVPEIVDEPDYAAALAAAK